MISNISTKSRTAKIRASDPIGVFDSGVGGLSILRELQKLLPHESFLFVADQAHVPYGEKHPKQLRDLSLRAASFLRKHRCKAIVVACNTATCHAIEHLRRHLTIPIIGTVPAIKPAGARSKNKSIAVIATPATARSKALQQLVAQHRNGASVLVRGCHGLEELIESGVYTGKAPRAVFAPHAAAIQKASADIVVLGCTHYPFIRRTIASMTKARTIDSGTAIARRVHAVLKEKSLLNTTAKKGSSQYWTSGSPARFSEAASLLLRRRITAKKARL